jgi:hypothetical protein
LGNKNDELGGAESSGDGVAMADDPKEREVRDEFYDAAKRGRGKGRGDSDARKKQDAYNRKALLALQQKDERAFSDALRLSGIVEGSEQWKRAWAYYRKACG